jgi:type IV fimbrial biogenesis protein FimT
MLRQASAARGISMIEVMVSLTLAALLMALGAPSFALWLQNSRIRNTAEAIMAGLQYAKSEATARNALVRFQLTTSVGSDCAISTSGTSWVVDMVDASASADSVAGQCNAAPSDTLAPSILQVRSASDGSGNTSVQSNAAELVFNGLARLTPPPATSTTIDISNPNGGRCAAQGGDLTCLRVVVSPTGQVRMCNPRYPAGDPQAC